MNLLARLAFIAVVALHLTTTTAQAQHASYARVRVSGGPVLEYPSHWKIADEATVQNRVHGGQATADAAGVDMSGFQKRNRVIVESQPFPSTAQVRASIVTPQEYTQEDPVSYTHLDVYKRQAKPGTPSIRLLAEDRAGGATEIAEAWLEAEQTLESLPRIAAARRLPMMESPEGLSLAVQYQLMSRQTNCILVHQRSDADKVTEGAELNRLQSMMAAGWGATGTVAFSQAAIHDYSGLNTPSVWRSSRSRAVAALDPLACNSLDSERLPEFLMTTRTPAPFNKLLHAAARPKTAPSTLVRRTTLKEIALAVVGQLDAGAAVEALAGHCERLELAPHLKQAIEGAQKIGAVGGQAWLLLAHWVNGRDDGGLGDAAMATLQPHLDVTPAGLIDACVEIFARELGRFESCSWRQCRKARLREALEKLKDMEQ